MIEIDNDIELCTKEKLISELSEKEWDAVLLFGFDNIQFAGGAFIPFLPYRPDLRVALLISKTGESYYICPNELVSSVKRLGKITDVFGYENDGTSGKQFVKAIFAVLSNEKLATKNKQIGIDFERIDHEVYIILSEEKINSEFIRIDKWLKDLRMVKTSGEIELLRQIAYSSDHAINGCLHHTIATYPKCMLSMAEEFRIHAMERGLFECGYNSIAHCTGHELNNEHWPECKHHGFNYGFSPVDYLKKDDLAKIQLISVSDGYWGNACRIFSYLEPGVEETKAYKKWLDVRNYFVSIIKRGKKCSDIYRDLKEFAAKNHIEFDETTLLGHSIGVTHCEAPFINDSDDTVIENGMVFVLSPAIIHDGELTQSNDTVLIKDDKAQVLNWWKDWREPYTAIPYL